MISILHFVWPLAVLYLALRVIVWKVYVMMFQPDLGYWIEAVAAVVFLKGLFELALLWRVFRQTHRHSIPAPA